MTSTQTVRRASAAIDFAPRYDIEGRVVRYVARPVGEGRLIDRTYDSAVRSSEFTCVIRLEYNYNGSESLVMYTLVTQGRERGGRRYRRFDNLDKAIKAAENWAARRFAYEIN